MGKNEGKSLTCSDKKKLWTHPRVFPLPRALNNHELKDELSVKILYKKNIIAFMEVIEGNLKAKTSGCASV